VTKGLILLTAAAAAAWAWAPPVNLGAPINTAYRETEVTITRKGEYLVFSSNRPGGAGLLDLWRSRYSGNAWTTPVNLGSNVNTASHDHRPFLAESDTKLYFASNVAAGGYGGFDIWWAPFSNGLAGPRNNPGPTVNSSSNEHSPVVSADGQTLFFSSDRTGGCFGKLDMWFSVKNGFSWSAPVNLGYGVNGSYNEGPVWLSADGKTLLFYSDRPGGSCGGYDFWYAEKSGSVWQNPANMGPVINSPVNEGGATFCGNHGRIGGIIYFGSRRAGGLGETDIWTSGHGNYAAATPASIGRIKSLFR
jgi:Tol biopolymer transport system component